MPRKPGTHVDDPKAVGQRLRKARTRAGLSQTQLAFPGCTAAYISRIEAGARIPSLQLLRELGNRLGVSEDYLASGRGDERRRAAERLDEAELALRLDDSELARRTFEDALEAAAIPEERARAHAGLGRLAVASGDDAAAIEHLEHARELAPELEDQCDFAEALGRAYARTGQQESAFALYQRGFAAAADRGDVLQLVRFGVLLSESSLDRGTLDRAEDLLRQVLVAAPDGSDPVSRARFWHAQSRRHAERDETDRAERYARLASDLLTDVEHVRSLARAHQLLAHVQLERGEAAAALELLDAGTPLAAAAPDELERVLFGVERARALMRLGKRAEARRLATAAAQALEQAGPADCPRAYYSVGEVLEALGEGADAQRVYSLAVESHGVVDRYLLEICARLADLLRQDGRPDEAHELLTRAVRLRAPASATAA